MNLPNQTPDIAASPVTIDIEGKTYEFSPLRLRDWADWDRWCQQTFLKARTALLEAESKTYEAEYRLLQRISSELGFGLPGAVGYMLSLEGKMQIIWLSIKTKHPEIKLEWIHDKYEQLLNLWNDILKISGVEFAKNGESDPKNEEPKTQKAQ